MVRLVLITSNIYEFLSIFFIILGDPKYDENWKSLTKMLNNTLGPKKSIEEWKTVSFSLINK
jgi:hypothetical protein